MVDEITVVLPREKFKSLKGKDVNELLRTSIPRVEETLRAEREEFLREKMVKFEEKLGEMEGEIEELREFYEKALRDREFMMTERDRLKGENTELREKFEAKRRGLEGGVHES